MRIINNKHKISTEKWNEKRDLTRSLLESINYTISKAVSLNVLMGAEIDYCQIIRFNLNSRILTYWDERSKASKERFCEGGETDA